MSLQKFDAFRSKKLTESARNQSCQNCGADDETVVWAHSNASEHGKGRSIKASDVFGAHLCFRCHSWLDQGTGFDPTGIWGDSRMDKESMFRRAHDKTLEHLFKTGKVVVT